jgi:uncharacterized Rossmann fold enzyme
VLAEQLGVEGELHEDVHFSGLLAHDQLAEVCKLQLIEAEETQISEDAVEGSIVAVGGGAVQLEEGLTENLEKVFVTDAAVEDLLDENFFVWVLELQN